MRWRDSVGLELSDCLCYNVRPVEVAVDEKTVWSILEFAWTNFDCIWSNIAVTNFKRQRAARARESVTNAISKLSKSVDSAKLLFYHQQENVASSGISTVSQIVIF